MRGKNADGPLGAEDLGEGMAAMVGTLPLIPQRRPETAPAMGSRRRHT